MQAAISKSLFLITVAIGLVTGANNIASAYEGNTWNVDSSNVFESDRIKSITPLQAQLPFPRSRSDRNDVRRNRREDLKDARRECLEEDDRDDRRDCFQNLRGDRNHNRGRNREQLGNRRYRLGDRPQHLPPRNRFPY